ncbi:MAG: fructosamine kinase family protein [Azoarcus sp.]|nr:fructosamine kinase family protein [Azoarcus sp.]
MTAKATLAAIEAAIRAALGSDFVLREHAPVAGGCTHAAQRVSDGARTFFVKTGTPDTGERFAAEADGLAALAATGAMRVPDVVAHGHDASCAWLVLEWLELRPLQTADDGVRFAEALAAQHRATGEHFGWHRDNFIGPTPQANTHSDNWARFFAHQRLAPQLARARANGYTGELQRHGKRLIERLPALFLDYRPRASLLHGDLWHGNAAITDAGEPAVFDAAVYHGDRESDLAMCELFGGFPPAFYAAYRNAWPLDGAYEARKPLYALYHVLNHLNLFGRSYLREAERLVTKLDFALGTRSE